MAGDKLMPALGKTVRLARRFKAFAVGTVFTVVQERPLRATYWLAGEGWPGQPSDGTLLSDREAWRDLLSHAEELAWVPAGGQP